MFCSFLQRRNACIHSMIQAVKTLIHERCLCTPVCSKIEVRGPPRPSPDLADLVDVMRLSSPYDVANYVSVHRSKGAIFVSWFSLGWNLSIWGSMSKNPKFIRNASKIQVVEWQRWLFENRTGESLDWNLCVFSEVIRAWKSEFL